MNFSVNEHFFVEPAAMAELELRNDRNNTSVRSALDYALMMQSFIWPPTHI